MKATPSNIDCFEMAAAAVLGLAYSSFPYPQDVFTDELIKELLASGRIPDSCIRPELERYGPNLIAATIDWLTAEGLVRHQDRTETGIRFRAVCLTASGFRALNSPVVPRSGGETYGERIARFSQGAASTVITSVISGIITAAATPGN